MSSSGTTLSVGPLGAAEQVRLTLFRILAALRVVVLVYALVVNVGRLDEMARPGLAWAALAAMVLWTVATAAVHELWRDVGGWFFALDVAVACAVLLLTLLTHSDAMQQRGVVSLPTLWVLGSVLAVSIGVGWWQAVVAALCVAVADVAVRVETTPNTWANIFLLFVAAATVGVMSSALGRSAEARAATERLQAAFDERARLARAVHDGVLQVLALVQRRAQDHHDLEELGRLAAEQESSLRRLVQFDARTLGRQQPRGSADSSVDLVHAVQEVAGGHHVSAPGEPVLLPCTTVEEVTAAVTECLLNVSRHVAPDAVAWVFVEDLGDEVVVSVRDDGPGIASERLDEAAREGRLGVSGSIRSRLRELGGSAELTTGPTIGTEWELHVPRPDPGPLRAAGPRRSAR